MSICQHDELGIEGRCTRCGSIYTGGFRSPKPNEMSEAANDIDPKRLEEHFNNAAFISDSRTTLPKALRIIEEMAKALEDVAKIGRGLDGLESAEERANYWSGATMRNRDVAGQALTLAAKIAGEG